MHKRRATGGKKSWRKNSDEPKKINEEFDYFLKVVNFLWQADESGYHHVWPDMKFGWKIVVGSVIGFFGAAFGSVGGVGGGCIFVPMLTLIIGFDPKSSTAISKCMITGAAGSSVYYNLKLRHPTLDMPLIDYDLALLFQPMLMLGISIGVSFNVLFADWMVTVLFIILFIFTSSKAFLRGVDTWKKETLAKKAMKKQSTKLFRLVRRRLSRILIQWFQFFRTYTGKSLDYFALITTKFWRLTMMQQMTPLD